MLFVKEEDSGIWNADVGSNNRLANSTRVAMGDVLLLFSGDNKNGVDSSWGDDILSLRHSICCLKRSMMETVKRRSANT